MDDAQFLVQAIIANAKQLGITWTLRPAVMHTIDVSSASCVITLDGDSAPMTAVNLIGGVNVGARVMCLIIPNQAVYIIGKLGNFLGDGELVCRIHQATPQTIPHAGSGTFIEFDTVDYDPFGFFDTITPDRVTPTVPGWYTFVGRVVYTANATSRRACFINTNGTLAAPGTLGGQSLQTPAGGSCQVQGVGAGLMNGTTDYAGVRALQNSGIALDTLSDSTDGGSTLEVFYSGPGRQ